MADEKPKVEVVPPTPPFPNIQVMPPPVPQLQWGHNFIYRFFHNWQLHDMSKAREKEADIFASAERGMTHQLNMITCVSTFMDKHVAEKAELNARTAKATHEIEMLVLEKQSKMLENQLKLAELNTEQLELKVKEKELRDVLAEPEIGTEG